jgi:hypothetical protein
LLARHREHWGSLLVTHDRTIGISGIQADRRMPSTSDEQAMRCTTRRDSRRMLWW